MKNAIQKAIEGGWMKLGDYAQNSIFYKNTRYMVNVDIKDLSIVSKYNWYMTKIDGYAVTSIKGKRVKMHHMIIGKPPLGKEVDHINRYRTDNRRANLRFVTSLENGQNTTAKLGGIRRHGTGWEANVCLNYKKFYKQFSTPTAAMNWRKKIKDRFIDHLASGGNAESFFADLIK